jgi:hypothetical protein
MSNFCLYFEETWLSFGFVVHCGPQRLCTSVEILHEDGGTQPSSDLMLREETRSMALQETIIR